MHDFGSGTFSDIDPTNLDVRYWGRSGNPQSCHHGCAARRQSPRLQGAVIVGEIIGWLEGAERRHARNLHSQFVISIDADQIAPRPRKS